VIPGFAPAVLEREIPGRVFASLFFPRRVRLGAALSPVDPSGIFRSAAAEFAAWVFAGEPNSAWQIPLDLSGGAYRVGPSLADPQIRSEVNALFSGALGYAVTRAALRDLLRARFLLDNGGLSPSPLSFIRSGRALLASAALPGAASALADVLSGGNGDAAALIKGSSWYEADAASAGTEPSALQNTRGAAPLYGQSFNLGGLEFVYVEGGELIQRLTGAGLEGGASFSRKVKIEGFWISRNEVSAAAWDRFTTENPRWAPAGRDALVKEGLVTTGYLEGYPVPPEAGATGVQGVSWHAADAFCAWLLAQAGQSGISPRMVEARLPEEAEWEYAARLSAGGGLSLSQMAGGLWEWCGDYYVPLPFLTGGEAIPAPERNIRGGAWINPPGTVNAGTRASLPPESCSPFVSFRPVIALSRAGGE
jgi:formylglycine-generating enzyme required for sulfatase activity